MLPRARARVPLVLALSLVVPAHAQAPTAEQAPAQRQAAPAPAGKLIQFVILSPHGVRSPIPNEAELDSWTTSPWPKWGGNGKPGAPRQLTPPGSLLAAKLGDNY